MTPYASEPRRQRGRANRMEPRPSVMNAATTWVHWEYSPQEWGQMDRLDWGKPKFRLLISGALSALLLLLGDLTAVYLGASVVGVLAVSGILLFLGLLFCYLVAGRQFWAAYKRHQARQVAPRSVTIGALNLINSQSMWMSGWYIPLQDNIFTQLLHVNLATRPFTMISLVRRNADMNGNTWYRDTIRLLVPSGHEDEARYIVDRFQRETLPARNQRYAPPEPK